MGAKLCTPKNVIVVEYDDSQRVKNFTIHGCYVFAPLQFQFEHPKQTCTQVNKKQRQTEVSTKQIPTTKVTPI